RTWLAIPRDWVASLGDIAKFAARDVGEIFGGKVFKFFGEALRQAGILILGSTLVIWSTTFILGLQCGIEGATSTARWARPPTPGCSRRGATCARSCPTRSAT